MLAKTPKRKHVKKPKGTILNKELDRKALLHITGFPGADLYEVATRIQADFPELVVRGTDDIALMSKKQAEDVLQAFINSTNSWVVFVGRVSSSVYAKDQPNVNCVYCAWYDVSLHDATYASVMEEVKKICQSPQAFMDVNARTSAKEMSKYLTDYLNLHHRMELWQPLHEVYRKKNYKPVTLPEILHEIRIKLTH